MMGVFCGTIDLTHSGAAFYTSMSGARRAAQGDGAERGEGGYFWEETGYF